MKTTRRQFAFTLIELLVVIAILGILAALAVPALKNLGKSNVQTSASRQLLDDIGRARQLAISDHTTVFMVFINTNFWNPGGSWLGSLTPSELNVVTNLMDKQLSGYTFIAYGALGDQPGQHQWHYLDTWQSLPQGFMVAPWKFSLGTPNNPFYFQDAINGHAFSIHQFDYANTIPFPVADSNELSLVAKGSSPYLPYIAFNYLGQLVSSANDLDVAGGGADIPIAQGYVSFPFDSTTKIPVVPGAALGPNTVTESPVSNSVSISYNIVHIDALTGRASLEFHQIQ